MKKSEFRGMFQKEIQEARKRTGEYVFYANMYCDSSDCNAREVDIKIKEVFKKTDQDLRCPLCGETLKTHSVYSLRESSHNDEKKREIIKGMNL